MGIYVKKRVAVEARQFLNDASSYGLIQWINEGQHAIGREFASWHNNTIVVPTLEGQHIASPGDWIIRGVVGEHYPCKPNVFEMTYEPAPEAPTEKVASVMDLRGSVSPTAGAPVVPVEQMRISAGSPEVADCMMCSQARVQHGVVACGSTVKCVGANQFKGRLTRVQLWKD